MAILVGWTLLERPLKHQARPATNLSMNAANSAQNSGIASELGEALITMNHRNLSVQVYGLVELRNAGEHSIGLARSSFSLLCGGVDDVFGKRRGAERSARESLDELGEAEAVARLPSHTAKLGADARVVHQTTIALLKMLARLEHGRAGEDARETERC